MDWSHHYAALLEYYKEHGTCNVPIRAAYECDLPNVLVDGHPYHYKGNLGTWLDNQRQAKKAHNGKLKGFSPVREAQLQLLVDEGKLSIYTYYE